MMTVREIKGWLGVLADDAMVGIDDGGLTLKTQEGEAYLEVGGLPCTCGATGCVQCDEAMADDEEDDDGERLHCGGCGDSFNASESDAVAQDLYCSRTCERNDTVDPEGRL